jgi:hypothetical protein
LTVRHGVEISSKMICRLETGTIIQAVQKQERRLRIISPRKGWVSEYAADGYKICKPLTTEGNKFLMDLDNFRATHSRLLTPNGSDLDDK